ncbi:replication initiator protein A [Paludisphaera sp.]|uniref:replication initiator protein A n=1 Tax=Paludisphaera sp. TaxID=2017432 RepID=UPI00301E5286
MRQPLKANAGSIGMAELGFTFEDDDEAVEPMAGRESEGGASCDAGWKDELNLAEFPIAALSDRIPDGQTTLVFEDRLEPRDSPPIVRRLTIMGTHKHGLPTSLDDEVLVGLIQLTKRRSNFTDARVPFSRYELIELLGWPQSGQSYRRIEEALHRWVGVVLMYENAWWDNTAKSWVDEQFHVLDNVTLYDRERWRKTSARAKAKAGGKADKPPLPLSSFKWNDVMFQSFQSGNLKQLDLELYLKLRLPTTKRMYRFLDKRFYRRSRLEFDLRTLACEHIGLSRTYAPTELKRRLKPALVELEQVGFLEPLPPEERYAPVSRGTWRIILVRGRRDGAPGDDPDPDDGLGAAEAPDDAPSELVEALRARGVTAKAATDLVGAWPADRVRAKIEVFDWMVGNGDKRVGKNPAGYLVASIRSDYQDPPDFRSATAAVAKREQADRKAADAKADADAAARAEADREARLKAAWDALPADQRDAILAAVKAENPGLSRWKKMLEPLCLAALEARLRDGAPGPAPAQHFLFPESDPAA